TMEEIVTSVKRVTDIMAEITVASQEQSGGIEQVNQAIVQMDRVTQQNAALVEEAAAAAESMKEQAQALSHAVSVFNVGQRAAPPPQVSLTTQPEALHRFGRSPARTGAGPSFDTPAHPALPEGEGRFVHADGASQGWNGRTERRSAQRARNVSR